MRRCVGLNLVLELRVKRIKEKYQPGIKSNVSLESNPI